MNSAIKTGWAEPGGMRVVLFTALITSLYLSAPAFAGLVTGQVRDEAGKPLVETTIVIKDSRKNTFRVKTDKKGMYNINLPPGIYQAVNPGKSTEELIMQSSPQSSRQDLDFGKR